MLFLGLQGLPGRARKGCRHVFRHEIAFSRLGAVTRFHIISL